MIKYVALIRGIGPGDSRMANDKLRGVLEGLGFSGVKSVISSGNIIFESDITDVNKLETMIEAALVKHLRFERSTIVKSQGQLQKLLDSDPFSGAPHNESSYLLITFFKQPTEPGFDLPYQPPSKPYTLVGYADNTLFSITNNTVIKTSDLMTWLEKQYSKKITSRTPLTIQRILNKMNS
jgi:uncharacterized protein (DUF1697 family)